VGLFLCCLPLLSPAWAANRSFPTSGWANPDAPAWFEDWGFGFCATPYSGNFAHLGTDSQGTNAPNPIVAMGAGTVVKSERNWPGDVLGIEHVAGDGTRFVGVYGHLNVEVWSGTVQAGQRIGTLYDQGSNDHLHLGIRPLAPGESTASIDLWGRSECVNGSAPTYGYVDPIPWLAGHVPGWQLPPSPPDQDGDGIRDSRDRDGARRVRLYALSVARDHFAAAARGAGISARWKPTSVGAKVSYRLSRAATVTFLTVRRNGGRRVGRFDIQGAKGKNSFGFRGRLRGRKLKPGGYYLLASAKNAAGNRSARRRVEFRITRR
jgi:hypothetical protein